MGIMMLIKLVKHLSFYTADGKIEDEFKFKINDNTLKIIESKVIGRPEDKCERPLFLPLGESRKCIIPS